MNKSYLIPVDEFKKLENGMREAYDKIGKLLNGYDEIADTLAESLNNDWDNEKTIKKVSEIITKVVKTDED